MQSKKFLIQTLGCKANLTDSQLLSSDLKCAGWQDVRDGDGGSADLVVINTCSVTDEADKQSLRLARKLARDNPGTRVVMTGCAAEVNPDQFLGKPGVFAVVGNQDKRRLAEFADQAVQGGVWGAVQSYAELRSTHPMDRPWALASEMAALPDQTVDRTRAFLKIQEGCNAFCTYCIIPYGRGPSRSLSVEQIVQHARALEQRGIRELVLTGTNIGDFGAVTDQPSEWTYQRHLPELVRSILAATRLVRVRLSSLDPVEITRPILDLMQSEERLCPHFHLSLQSPHSAILRRMKRKYTSEQAQERLQEIAELKTAEPVFVGMDVITGFPGETEEIFAESTRSLQKWSWSRLHVFPYSERSGTPATRLGGKLNVSTRVQRARVWNQMSLERFESRMQTAAQRAVVDEVILEAPRRDGSIEGYSPGYVRVVVPREKAAGLMQNQTIRVRPLEIMSDRATYDVKVLAQPL